MVPDLLHKTLTSFDGTTIAYQVRRGREEAPWVVLANGLGGTFEAFRHVYDVVGDRANVVCWDYRGLYGSAVPSDPLTLAIPYHARDLAAVLDAERVRRAVFVGWSMGVQVNFEYYRQHRERFDGIIVLNGTYGTPFRTAMASRLARYVIPLALSAMKTNAGLVSRGAQAAVAWAGLLPTMVRLGMISHRVDVDAMLDVAAGFQHMDFGIYSDILRHLGAHDARDVLSTIDVPVLIMTGDRDVFTPVFTARKMNRLIRGSRLVVIEGGTHYTPIEFPDQIGDEIARFLAAVLPARSVA